MLLNDAINSGDAGRIAAFFNGYRQAAGQAPPQQQQHSHSSRGSSGKRIYSRDDIRELYEMHRCGEFTGREAEWNRIEADIFAAQREGRILNPDRISK